MDKKAYAAKFKDPKWQKLRLEVMQRDDFACCRCGDAESHLNVHHCYYEWDNDPWEYPHSSLVTLCENCHQEETEATPAAKAALWQVFASQGVLCDEIGDFVNGVQWTIDGRKQHAAYVIHVLQTILHDDDAWEIAVMAHEEYEANQEALLKAPYPASGKSTV